jgi:hypothetical protein
MLEQYSLLYRATGTLGLSVGLGLFGERPASFFIPEIIIDHAIARDLVYDDGHSQLLRSHTIVTGWRYGIAFQVGV